MSLASAARAASGHVRSLTASLARVQTVGARLANRAPALRTFVVSRASSWALAEPVFARFSAPGEVQVPDFVHPGRFSLPGEVRPPDFVHPGRFSLPGEIRPPEFVHPGRFDALPGQQGQFDVLPAQQAAIEAAERITTVGSRARTP